MIPTARQLALQTIRSIYKGAFADVALDRLLRRVEIVDAERRLLTELVYGIVRRQRTLDALIDQFAKKKAHQQHPDIRIILHIGLYQLRYLDHIPAAAAVHSTVELARQSGFAKLKGFINGLLRQYLRQSTSGDPLLLPDKPATRLGILHSYPDWLINLWLDELGLSETEALCQWLNQPPSIDLRLNPLRCSEEALRANLRAKNIEVECPPFFAQALRLKGRSGFIEVLPGFKEGHWTVQDSSAQLVSLLLDPQAGEVIIDACAAPGGKSTHIAQLIGDEGIVWACDRTASRLRKVQANSRRLGLHAIRIRHADSRHIPDFRLKAKADRVLLDAPCSNLGTLHRHADARWRQTPASVRQLATLQQELLTEAATWLKAGGILVYATCTLHPAENEENIKQFLSQHPSWQIISPPASSPAAPFATPEGWIKVWPHRHQMDGFFMVKLRAL
jgi:16S rRNA (cytosine967-C5)-methyltransferase